MPSLDNEYSFFHSLGKRFTDLKVIGGGGSSVVLAGTDISNDHRRERVALKRLSLKSKGHCRVALRELRILKNLRHDNVVRTSCVTDCEGQELSDSKCRDVDCVFLVQELLDGDLHSVLEHNGAIPEDVTKLLMYQLLRGLKYIHSANVVHRDIKPGNLFLNSEDLTLKIGDYGLARIVDPSFDHCGYLTELVTTRYYRAPEVMLRPGGYGFAVDLWSAGCVMAEMLTGSVVFPGCNDLDQLECITSAFKLKGSDESNSTLPNYKLPGVSEEALQLIQLLLKMDPADRLTAEEALSHPYFSNLSDVDDEPVCQNPFRVEHEIDNLSRGLLKKLIWSDSCSYPFSKSEDDHLFDGFDENFCVNDMDTMLIHKAAAANTISSSDDFSLSSLESFTNKETELDSAESEPVASLLDHYETMNSLQVIKDDRDPQRDPGCAEISAFDDAYLSVRELDGSDSDSHHSNSLFPRYSPILQTPGHLNCNRELLLLDKRLARWEKWEDSGTCTLHNENIVGKLRGMCLQDKLERSKELEKKLDTDAFLNSSISHWDQLRVWI